MKKRGTGRLQAPPTDCLAGGGEMGALIRAYDWSQTPLGPVANWPQSLKTAVRIMLTSRQPIWLGWGAQLIKLYNDPYQAIVGGKHPGALGQPAAVVWREIWPEIGPMLETALGGVEGTYVEAQLLIMERNGYPEETYYTFSYSPIPNDQGGVGGIICANTDDTERVIGERQLTLLRELAARTADARTVAEACALSMDCLGTNPYDLPFAMIYLAEPEARRVALAGQCCGIERGHAVAPDTALLDEAAVWPFAEVLATNRAALVTDLSQFANSLPAGAWDRPPHQAVAVPIAPQGRTGQAGILVVGLNPYRLFDDKYRGFLELVAAQIAANIANAQAYEEERRRAEALAELDRAKTEFFSNVSHEFRTPLTLMLGPLEDLLAQSNGQHNHRAQLEVVHRNSLRLLKLVNTLLDFSRFEAGRIRAAYEPVELATYTAELASVFRAAIEKAGLQLIVDCPPLKQPVYVDREMWEKIVLNLLSNALKFTFKGEIEVSLRQARGDSAGSGSDPGDGNGRRRKKKPLASDPAFVELRVRDTGTGIPKAELPHLFERFHRVRGARSRSHEGSGIGLALVQELAKLHGGNVRVESRVNRGTTFIVTIPTGTAHLPADRVSPSGAARALTATGGHGEAYVAEAARWLPDVPQTVQSADGFVAQPRKDSQVASLGSPPQAGQPTVQRLLLADDNADMREYVRRLLSQDYEVVAVGDGAAALQAARGEPFDLVLTDVMMPQLDGFGLLKELRADERTRTLPIILLSARAGEESRVEGMEAGADDYLIKPFSARELLARVEARLQLERVRREAAAREAELRREAETAHEQSEAVLASIRDAFSAFDRDWRYTYINDRGLALTRLRRADFIGRTLWEVFPDLVGTEFEARLQQAMAARGPAQFEHYYPAWERWLENRVYPSAAGLSLFTADITDRKQAEEALRVSEEKYRTVFNSIDEGFCVVEILLDDQGRPRDYLFLEINPVFGQLTGLSNAIGKTARELVPDLEEFWIETYGRVALTGEAVRFENYAEPMHRWFNVHASRVGGEESRRVAIVFTNITERKRAEETERRAAARDAFRVALADALRPLADPVEIQATAGRVLGEHLGANRVAYFEVRGADYFVARDYVNDAVPLAGAYPVASFGPQLLATYRSGRVASASDVAGDDKLSQAERAAYAGIQIGAYVGVPLIKGGEFVAGLAVHTRGPRHWTPDEIALAEETAERTWAAVERARAEAAVRASEEKYRTLFDSIDEGYCVIEMIFDEQGKAVDYLFEQINPAFSRLCGLPEDTAGKRMREMIPNHEEHWFEIYGRVARTGESIRFENYAVGLGRWFDVYALRIGGDGSRRVGVVFNDITARKRRELTQQFILDLDKRLGALSEPEEIEQATIDLLGQYLRASHCYFAHIYNNERGVIAREFRAPAVSVSLIAEHLVTAYNPPDRIAQFLRGETVVNHDVVADAGTAALADNFALFQIRAFISTPVYFGGEWVGILNATSHTPRVWREDELELLREVASRVWPLMERARAVAAVRQSEERYRGIVNQTLGGIAETDLTGRFTTVNDRYCAITGYTREELTNLRLQEITHPEDLARNLALFEKLLTAGTPFEVEKRYVRRDGSPIWVHNSVSAIRNAAGAPQSVIAVSIDITERKQIEEALRENDRRKDEFLAMLAHELRNPLAPITNAVHVLKLLDPAQPQLQWAQEIIERQTQHMTRLVDDLLDVSRITRGKVTLQRQALDVTAIINRAVETARPLVDAHRHQLSITMPAEPLRVEGDLTRLVQVVGNLLNNAAKYTDDGGRIQLEVTHENNQVIIRVRDNGVGLPAELLPQVFDLFTQAKRSLDRSQGGLGIGLTLVRSLVELHGGTVEAHSAGLGQGSEFTVRLPEFKPAPVADRAATDGASARAAAAPKLKVLIVEDNADAAESLAFLLRFKGHDVRLAHDGLAALAVAQDFQPQAILLDIGLPELDGYEVARRLRAQPEFHRTLLIALTGYGQEEDRRQAQDAGFDHHLTKPVEPTALNALLQKL